MHDVQTNQAPDQGHQIELSHYCFQNRHGSGYRRARNDVAIADGSRRHEAEIAQLEDAADAIIAGDFAGGANDCGCTSRKSD